MRKNRSPQPLRLSSYKIDNSSLQQNLKQLNEMKSELETTISHYKMNEGYYVEENERLRDEIAMLQKKLGQKIEHAHCQQAIALLEEQLLSQRVEVEKYKSMYEVERRNKEEINSFYERKLGNWQNDSKLLVENYEQRIASLKNELSQVRSVQASILEKGPKPTPTAKLLRENSSSNFASDSERSSLPFERKLSKNYQQHGAQSPTKTTIGAPPKNPSGAQLVRNYVSEKEVGGSRNPTPQWKHGDARADPTSAATDEECFDACIRKLYCEIKEMGITPREALILPQFKKLKSLINPVAKDLATFFKNPPIQEGNSHSIEKNVKYLQAETKKKYGDASGNMIAQFIISRVEEYQDISQMNSEDLEISGMTPSQHKGQSSYGLSSLSHSVSNRVIADSQQSPRNMYGSRPSASSEGLRIESDASYIR